MGTPPTPEVVLLQQEEQHLSLQPLAQSSPPTITTTTTTTSVIITPPDVSPFQVIQVAAKILLQMKNQCTLVVQVHHQAQAPPPLS